MSNYKNIDPNQLKWVDVDGETGEPAKMHCYYPSERKDSIGQYTGETHAGNSALCSSRRGISEDGDSFVPFRELRESWFDEGLACKRCLKIFDKIVSKTHSNGK